MRPSYEHITDPIIKRILIGLDREAIKEAFNISESEFQAKMDEAFTGRAPKEVKKVSKKKKK